MKAKSLVHVSGKTPVRVEPLTRFAPVPKALKRSGVVFPKDFKAGVVMDARGAPRYFVFDTASLWDLLCAADAALEAGVSAETYVHHNPIGWLIDAIESHMPLNPKLVAKLKKGLKEVQQLGVVPFEKVKAGLGLS